MPDWKDLERLVQQVSQDTFGSAATLVGKRSTNHIVGDDPNKPAQQITIIESQFQTSNHVDVSRSQRGSIVLHSDSEAWLSASTVDELEWMPEKNDEIHSANVKYKITQVLKQAGGDLQLVVTRI